MEEDSTPELEAIENLTDYLEKLLKKPERQLVNFLLKEGFINKTESEEILNVRSMMTANERGGMIVQAIMESV